MRLLVRGALPHGQTFTKDYVRAEVLSMMREENVRFHRKHSGGSFFLHIVNSPCHNDKKITDEIEHRRFARAPHPHYSPDLSPCGSWLFRLIKHNLSDREIQGVQKLIGTLTKA
jgi:hypothetical protein